MFISHKNRYCHTARSITKSYLISLLQYFCNKYKSHCFTDPNYTMHCTFDKENEPCRLEYILSRDTKSWVIEGCQDSHHGTCVSTLICYQGISFLVSMNYSLERVPLQLGFRRFLGTRKTTFDCLAYLFLAEILHVPSNRQKPVADGHCPDNKVLFWVCLFMVYKSE